MHDEKALSRTVERGIKQRLLNLDEEFSQILRLTELTNSEYMFDCLLFSVEKYVRQLEIAQQEREEN